MFTHQIQGAEQGSSDSLPERLSNLTGLDSKVINMALKARKVAMKKDGLEKANTLTIIDYSKPSTHKRLWVLDLKTVTVLFNTFVAHGRGTGANSAEFFSDKNGSHQSSLGVFKTGSTYHGSHGSSLNLHGLEKGFNGNAYSRRIVIHAADYVNEHIAQHHGRLGLSHGCPALNPKVTSAIIHKIKNGSLIFAYYPDKNWLNRSHYLN